MSVLSELREIQTLALAVFPGSLVIQEALIEPEVEQISLFDLQPSRVEKLIKRRKPKESKEDKASGTF